MKQIIYLGGKKAREYDGVDEPEMPVGLRKIELGGKVPENFSTNDHVDYFYEMEQHRAHISTLPVVDVIGDCDWKEGEVKTEGVDYVFHDWWGVIFLETIKPQDATPQEWEKALISLTPGGSEYVGDPARCVEAVKDFRDIQHSQIVKLTKELSTLRSELSAAQEENKKLREVCQLRPEVLWFAQQMERKLRANDHKPGWQGDSLGSLMKRIDQECAELYAVIKSPGYESRITDEAADVANFAMMIADNAKNQSNKRTPPESGEQTKD